MPSKYYCAINHPGILVRYRLWFPGTAVDLPISVVNRLLDSTDSVVHGPPLEPQTIAPGSLARCAGQGGDRRRARDTHPAPSSREPQGSGSLRGQGSFLGPYRPTRGSLTSPSYLARNRTLGPPLENNPEPPPSSVVPSNHLILCRPLLLLPQSPPVSESFLMSQLFA